MKRNWAKSRVIRRRRRQLRKRETPVRNDRTTGRTPDEKRADETGSNMETHAFQTASSQGQVRVVLLPVEPYLGHVYWETDRNGIAKNRQESPSRNEEKVFLKFQPAGSVESNAGPFEGAFDVEVDLEAGNKYVHIDRPARAYFVELGYESKEGGFFSMGRSNVAVMPPAQPAAPAQEQYLRVSKKNERELLVETVHAGQWRGGFQTTQGRSPALPYGQDVAVSDPTPVEPTLLKQGRLNRGEGARPFPLPRTGPANPELAWGFASRRFLPITPPFVATPRVRTVHRGSPEHDLTAQAEKAYISGLESSPIPSLTSGGLPACDED